MWYWAKARRRRDRTIGVKSLDYLVTISPPRRAHRHASSRLPRNFATTIKGRSSQGALNFSAVLLECARDLRVERTSALCGVVTLNGRLHSAILSGTDRHKQPTCSKMAAQFPAYHWRSVVFFWPRPPLCRPLAHPAHKQLTTTSRQPDGHIFAGGEFITQRTGICVLAMTCRRW